MSVSKIRDYILGQECKEEKNVQNKEITKLVLASSFMQSLSSMLRVKCDVGGSLETFSVKISKSSSEFVWLGVGRLGYAYHFGDTVSVALYNTDKFAYYQNVIRQLLSGGDIVCTHLELIDMGMLIGPLMDGVESFTSALTIALMIGAGRRLYVDHIHCSSLGFRNVHCCRLYDSGQYVVFRYITGYQFYGEASDEELLEFCEKNPLVHLDQVKFKLDRARPANVDELLARLRRDPDYNSTVYEELVYCLQYPNTLDRVTGHLRLAHAKLYGEKVTPRVVVLTGKPGCGKSKFCKDMVGSDCFYYRHDDRCKNFWDGYAGQSSVVIDDLGHYDKREWLIILQMVSDSLVPLPMASASHKGQIYFCSPLIVITTNCYDKIFDFETRTRDALLRRMDFLAFETSDLISYRLFFGSVGSVIDIFSMSRDQMFAWSQIFKVGYSNLRISVESAMVGAVVNTVRILNECVFNHVPYLQTLKPVVNGVLSLVTLVSQEVLSPLLALIPSGKVHIPAGFRKMYYAMNKYDRRELVQHINLMMMRPYARAAEVVSAAFAEGNIVSNEVFGKNEDVFLCGKMVACPDLKPYARPVSKVTTHGSSSIEYTEEEMGMFALMVDDIEDFKSGFVRRNGKYVKDSPSLVRTEAGYVLRDLPEDLKNFYKEGEFFTMFAPLSDIVSTTIDESEYKPNFNTTQRLVKRKLNELLNLKTSLSNNTHRRKEERRRQAARRKGVLA